ncbi:hypothetical protein RUM44_011491 [Polyplax serrata]|uniref:Uncharacterized protein n=1 Tax=Polyplax serrata TaxID=468196 RepID=A0ABR1AQV6_POLSC
MMFHILQEIFRQFFLWNQYDFQNPVNPKILESAGHLNSGSLNLNQINKTLHSGRQKRDTQQEIAALEARLNEAKTELDGRLGTLNALEEEKERQMKSLEEAKKKNDANEIKQYTDSLKDVNESITKEKEEIQKKQDEVKNLQDELDAKKYPNGKPTEKSTTPDGKSDPTATNAPADGSSQSPPKSTSTPNNSVITGAPPLQSNVTSFWNFLLQKKMFILSQLLDGIKNLATAFGNKLRADVQFLRGRTSQKTT